MTGGLGGQVARFGVVGVAATVIHVLLALFLHGVLEAPPLLANLGGFCGAWLVSYLGNHRWTFRAATRHGWSVPRHVVVAVLGLGVNQAIVSVMTEFFLLPFATALAVVVFVVPAVSFVLSRWWAFDAERGGRNTAEIAR